MVSQHSTEVVQTSLAGAICKGLVGRDAQTVNAANVDYSRRVALRSGLLHHRCQQLSDGKNAVEVEREDSCPGGGGIFIVRSGPIGAGVVDKNMEF